ncbi:probable beta-1,4-xylosyltransferase IRX10 [Zingiber officinale]|uniref:probable beta-1,4-xylosyltransferase IRX10 n=1 Tax=Zingiber officinale TaxID=94328 RepID=UPI001C4B9E31|nr:probable beta-1,4-xylosyltransferase IRX10 [Zingiber officinale]
MGSVSRGRNLGSGSGLPTVLCGRSHKIGAIVLVVATFLVTRALDRLSCDFPSPSSAASPALFDRSSGYLSWPERSYGSRLDLKIYVYEEQEIDGLRELMRGRDGRIPPDACLKGQWGTQVKIHQLLLKSRFRTLNKEEADLFFVPSYVKCVRMMGGLSDKEINKTYVKILSQMPHFRYSGGRDHIFVFPSGAGAHLFRSWATFLNRSIILTPEGDRTDKRDVTAFNTWKDIIIPGNVDDGMTKLHGPNVVQPIPLSKRNYLANFLGRAQGKVGRLQLVELAKQYPDKLESPELHLTGPNKLGRTEYFNHLRNAKFCLAPRGESSWTLRFYESFFVECVPVIISDQVELPFQNVIDYTQISIKWPSTRISTQLFEYLESIPDEVIETMIARGRQVRCLWVYTSEAEPCSAMIGIMWELQRKVRRFHQSAETFWLHNGSVVNRDLVEFHRWRTPVPLP